MIIAANKQTFIRNENKIILVVLGGLGGIQSGPNMLTELQQAHKPNLNALAKKSVCGLLHVVAPGVIPAQKEAIPLLLGYKQEEKRPVPIKKRYGLKACIIMENDAHHDWVATLGLDVHYYSSDIAEGIKILEKNIAAYDLICLHTNHIKRSALRGDYYEKVKAIEDFDPYVPNITALTPEVIVITGDSSIPTALSAVSWHPVPILIYSPHCRYDYVQSFDEIACSHGGLGIFSSDTLMTLLMANAGRSLPVPI